jgi:hypothetical protein
MPDMDDLALWYALNQQMSNYWADVDYNGGSRAHEFYLPEALFAVGNNRFEGAEKIRAFYARRRKHGTTTTRHLVGNLRVLRDDECCVWSLGVMSLYRADGRPPLSVGKTARHDRGFRSPMRARRQRAVAFSIACPATDFRRQRPPGFDLDRPAALVGTPKYLGRVTASSPGSLRRGRDTSTLKN